MHDTSPAAEQVRLAAIRRVAPIERLRLAFELSEAMRNLALIRLRAAHPGQSERELAGRLLGGALVPGHSESRAR
jgi:hypothetical protein